MEALRQVEDERCGNNLSLQQDERRHLLSTHKGNATHAKAQVRIDTLAAEA